MRTTLTSHFLSEAEYDSWQTLVEDSSQGSIYSSPTYLDALCRATGDTFRILAAKRSDEMVGGVALFEERNGGRVRVVPRKLLFYNGIVLRNTGTKYPSKETSQLLEATSAIEVAMSDAGYQSIILKNRPSFTDARVFLAKGWTAQVGYTYVVPIRDLKTAWGRVEQNLRRLVRRCVDERLEVSDDDDFESFWRMHAATTERKDLGRYLPETAFRQLFITLHRLGLCRLFHARLPSGQSVSAQLVLLGDHDTSHTVTAATDAEYLSMGVTAFLRWKVFERLADLGYGANDLTDATLNPVSHFKAQLGGDLQACLLLSNAAPPRLRRRVRLAVRALRGR